MLEFLLPCSFFRRETRSKTPPPVLPPPRRAKSNHPTYKVLLVGDSAVGKSQLLSRFANDTFDIHSKSTIGVEFVTREVDVSGAGSFTPSGDGPSAPATRKQLVNMQIWDTAGQERCGMISTAYYRHAKGVIIVYDVTRKPTLLDVPRWVAHAKQFCDANCVFIVIGNKQDLRNLKAVKPEEAEEICHILGVRHYDTSALTGDGVPTAFYQLILAVHAVTQANAVSQGSMDPTPNSVRPPGHSTATATASSGTSTRHVMGNDSFTEGSTTRSSTSGGDTIELHQRSAAQSRRQSSSSCCN